MHQLGEFEGSRVRSEMRISTARQVDISAVADVLDALVLQVDKQDCDRCQDVHEASNADSDWQCAICLNEIQLADLSVVQVCGHSYCVTCILQWATARKDASCPTCKTPFDSLLVHRDVDGTLSDAPVHETVAFLARAPWYVHWAQEQNAIRDLTRQHAVFRSVDMAASARSPLAVAQEEWAEEAMYGYFEDQFDDDEALVDYYVGRASSTRPTFGNRPWGPGGYVRSGRRRAAPVQPQRSSKGAVKGRVSGASSSSSDHSGGKRGNSGGGGSGTGAGPSAQGRRAKRNAKRADAFGPGQA